MLLGVITIPYLVHQVGVEKFGILTLVWALIGYFSLFDFGLGRALTQQIANKRAGGLVAQLPGVVKTGLLLTGATGILGGVILIIAAYPLGYRWLNVSVALQQATFYSLIIASMGIPFTTVATGLRGVLEAYEDFKTVNLLRMALGIANFCLPVLSVFIFGPRLDMMVFSLVLARLLILFAHIFFVHKITPGYLQTGSVERGKILSLLSFGGWMTVSNIISPLLVVFDRFIISFILGAGVVAYYTVPFEVLFRVLLVPMALTAALFPRFTSLFTIDLQAAKQLYKKSLTIVFAVMFLICFLIVISSYEGLKIWLGQDFAEKSWHISAVLAIGVFFNSLGQIPFAALHALGRVRITAFIHLGELVLYIPLLFVFLSCFGLLGAALIWVVRMGCDMLILLSFARKSMARPGYNV